MQSDWIGWRCEIYLDAKIETLLMEERLKGWSCGRFQYLKRIFTESLKRKLNPRGERINIQKLIPETAPQNLPGEEGLGEDSIGEDKPKSAEINKEELRSKYNY